MGRSRKILKNKWSIILVSELMQRSALDLTARGLIVRIKTNVYIVGKGSN